VEYVFKSGTRIYEEGLLNEEIITLMENADRVGEIIKEEIGQEKYIESLPYFPVCESCGRIYTTNAYNYLAKEYKVLYSCQGMEVKGRWLEGCGQEGEVNILTGRGKLSWKVEFAARWKGLDIRFEAYGKDIADSVRVNDRICREIFKFEPPMHVQYEMFLDRGGKKISKSAGNVFTPQVWFRYGSPQSLNLLILKRFVGAKSGSVDDIPSHMDEFDDLEDIYFGRTKARDEKEYAKLSGLYQYCWILKPPDEPSVHIPYRLITNLAMVSPKGSEATYIIEKLREYGYLDQIDRKIEDRIHYALNWVEDFGKISIKSVSLTSEEAIAVENLIEVLRASEGEEEYQSSVFNVARKRGLQPRRLFRVLYQILLGRIQGPRFGPYVAAMGKDRVIKELERTIRHHISV